MNLGLIYLLSFLATLTVSLGLALLMASILRVWRFTQGTVAFVAMPLWFVIGLFGLESFHQLVFAVWHRMQNNSLPREHCLMYEPSFYRLYASYQMSSEKFDSWINTHDWKQQPTDNVMCFDDGEKLKLDFLRKVLRDGICSER